MWTAAQEADQTEGEEDKDKTDTAEDDYLSGEDTVVNITLGRDPNALLVYAPGLELCHPIMGKLGDHKGQ